MKINIEDIEKHMEFRKKINNAELEDIEFYEKGKLVEIGSEFVYDWGFTGLNNIDFITSQAYIGSTVFLPEHNITYSIRYDDNEYIATCEEFPSLSSIEETMEEAVGGLLRIVTDVREDIMQDGKISKT